MGQYYHNPDSDNPNSEVDYEAQRAARNAIMQIKDSRDFMIMFRRATGYGPHVDMMQQFVFWFHPRHPTMRNRWSLWKTFAEWMDECALTERQVKKGRKVLADMGLATHKRGQYSRVYYSVDWVAVADVMGIKFIPDGITVQNDNFDELENEDVDGFIPDAMASDFIPDGNTVQFIPDGNTVRLNTGDNAGENLQDSYSLQRGEEPACAEPSPQEIDGEKPQKQVQEQPLADNVSATNGHAPSKANAGEGDGRGAVVEITPRKPEDAALLAEIEAVLTPGTGWHYAGLVRSKRDYYTPARIAESLAREEELPRYDGRAEELEPYIGYILWRESRKGSAA